MLSRELQTRDNQETNSGPGRVEARCKSQESALQIQSWYILPRGRLFQKTSQASLPSSEMVIIFLQSQTITEWLRLARTFGSNPCSLRDTQSRRLRTQFRQVQRSPKISKEHTPQLLWAACIIVCHLHSKKVLSARQTEHLLLQFLPIASCPSFRHTEKSLTLCSFQMPLKYLQKWIRFPQVSFLGCTVPALSDLPYRRDGPVL